MQINHLENKEAKQKVAIKYVNAFMDIAVIGSGVVGSAQV